MENKQTLLACLFIVTSSLVGCADGTSIFDDGLFADGLFGDDFELNLCLVESEVVTTVDGTIVPGGVATLAHGLDASGERSVLAVVDAEGTLSDVIIQLDGRLPAAGEHTVGPLMSLGATDCPTGEACFSSADSTIEPIAYTITSTNNEGERFLILDLARGDETFFYSVRFPATELNQCIGGDANS